MSACISREGEFSEHRYGDAGDEWTCDRCWVFDEDGALKALDDAAVQIAVVRAMARTWALGNGPGSDPEWYGRAVLAALASDPTHAQDADGGRG